MALTARILRSILTSRPSNLCSTKNIRPLLSPFLYPAPVLSTQSRFAFSSMATKGKDLGADDLKGLGGTTDLSPTPEPLHEINAWSGPGQAAFDFRSDVHESAIFVLSGTMGNQIALRSHLIQPPYSVLCDHRAHILEWEAGGTASLCGALVKGVAPSNGVYLTLKDVEKHVTISDDIHSCPTRVISLENTLAGTIMPFDEVKAIAGFARKHGIKLHMDGARLWEAVVAGAGSLTDFTRECDSVSLCFSKGLGAPVGSMLVGKKDFIKHARWVRKSIGGGLRQAGVLTAAARVAVDETFGKGPNGEGGLLRESHKTAKKIATLWEGLGGKLQQPTETNMVWLDLEDAGISAEEFSALGKEKGLKLLAGRLVVHYQIGEEAVAKLGEIMKVILERKGKGNIEVANKRRKIGEKDYGTWN
ncbi:hypothetical protein DID88_002723 [Monilinia fructigena]|uniref:Aromatic amino acid beta-eliminating lyase/threonine aldolase domain-containing protein n=1 Tax=Monilinia fructigena TaxID=38457 RepID=A0A395IP57_9HELO|nr:hypothetical protein DID88_002723 [Monilinia fructigena]